VSITTGGPRHRPRRQSITPTYDSRKTGVPYHVTTKVNGHVIEWQKRIDDPFVRQTVTIGWPDLLRSLFRRRAEVEVLISADRDVMEDVLELNDNYLGANCTRRDQFNADLFPADESAVASDDPGNGQSAGRADLS
jgi:hypothetical protein